MAADRKVQYQIEILQTGDGAAKAATQLQQVDRSFKSARESAGVFMAEMTRSMPTASAAVVQSFNKEIQSAKNYNLALTATTLSMVNYRQAAKSLSDGLRLVGFTVFPQATMAASTFNAAVRGVSGAAAALKIPLGAAGGVLASLATVVWSGVQGWRAYNAELKSMATLLEAASASSRLALTQQQIIKQLGTNLTPDQRIQMQSRAGDPGNGLTFQLLSTQQDVQRRAASAVEDAANGATVAANLARLQGMVDQSNLGAAEPWIRQRSELTRDYMLQLREIQAMEAQMGGMLTEGPRATLEANYDRSMDLVAAQEMERQINAIRAANDKMHTEDFEGWTQRMQAMDRANAQMNQYREMVEGAAQAFSQGLSSAIVDWASGIKDADDAFREFAQNFARQISQMILQQLFMRSISGVFGFGGGAASGGVFPRMMAGGGIAGVDMVSRPTYFPRFNTLAGEAGSEWLTVLSRPRMMDLGGISAAVGEAQGRTMALAPAAQLAGGGRGPVEIRLSLSPGLQAELVSQSIKGARVVVVQDMTQDSDLSKATRRLVS